MENQLQKIVKESGLETAKAQYILEKFQGYFAIAAEWEVRAKHIIVTDASQTTEMKMARVGRLFLAEKRIAVEKARKQLKEQALREGKAIDGIANVLKALIVPTEEYLRQQEQFVEIQQAKELEQKGLEIERRLEEERIAKEKAEAEERERIRLENERLKAEAIEREKRAKAELAAERAKADEKAKVEAEKVRIEREKQAKIFAEQKAKEEKEKKAIEEKAKTEKMELLNRQIECPFCHKKFIPKKRK